MKTRRSFCRHDVDKKSGKFHVKGDSHPPSQSPMRIATFSWRLFPDALDWTFLPCFSSFGVPLSALCGHIFCADLGSFMETVSFWEENRGFRVDITGVENSVESVKNHLVTGFVTGCNLCYFFCQPGIISALAALFVNLRRDREKPPCQTGENKLKYVFVKLCVFGRTGRAWQKRTSTTMRVSPV